MADEMNIFLEDLEDFLIPSQDFKLENLTNTIEEIDTNKDKEDVEEVVQEVQEISDTDTPPKAFTKDNELSSSSNILSELVNAMQEEGWFELKDGEILDIKTPQEFEKVIEKIRDTALETEQRDWTQQQRDYFNAIKNGMPHETVVQHQQLQSNLDTITDDVIEDENNEQLRRNILKAYYNTTGLDNDEVEDVIDTIFKEGSDIEKSKKFKNKLKALSEENFKKQQEALSEDNKKKTAAIEAQQKEYKEFVGALEEILPGEKLTPRIKKEVDTALTKPVSYDENGNPRNIISDFFAKEGSKGAFKIAYLLKVTEGLKNMDKLSAAKAKKETMNKISKVLTTPSSSLSFTKEETNDIVSDNIDWDKILT